MPDRGEGDNDFMYRSLMVPDDWLPDLFEASRRATIGLFASVFSVRAVHTLLKFDAPYIKLASMDSTPLSEELYFDIISAVAGRRTIVVSSNHDGGFPHGRVPPGPMLFCPHSTDTCLNGITFGLGREGFSDHSPGIHLPLRAIRQGATMIEKHFKLDDGCVDAAFSADRETMKLLCKLAHR
jgi:sialic acid synthase SpsE